MPVDTPLTVESLGTAGMVRLEKIPVEVDCPGSVGSIVSPGVTVVIGSPAEWVTIDLLEVILSVEMLDLEFEVDSLGTTSSVDRLNTPINPSEIPLGSVIYPLYVILIADWPYAVDCLDVGIELAPVAV